MARNIPRALVLAAFVAALSSAALAQDKGYSSSAPSTAGVNPGSVSKETVGGAPNRDTGTAGTANSVGPGNGTGTGSTPLGANPLEGGTGTSGQGTGAGNGGRR